MLFQHLTNLEYKVSTNSRDNLPDKIKDEAYVMNLDEYVDIGMLILALIGLLCM